MVVIEISFQDFHGISREREKKKHQLKNDSEKESGTDQLLTLFNKYLWHKKKKCYNLYLLFKS